MANYSVNSGQNIFDIVINTVQDFNSIYSLLQSNNIPKLLAPINGINVTYTKPPVTPPTVISNTYKPVINVTNFSSIPNQSVYDVCLQTYGDLNKTYKLIQDSGFANNNKYPLPNTNFTYDKTQQKDAIFASYLSKKGVVINTVNGNIFANSSFLIQDNGYYILLDDLISRIII